MGGNGKRSDLPDLAVSDPDPAALPDLAVASDLSDLPDGVVSALPDFP